MSVLDKFIAGRIADYLADFSEGRIKNPPILLEPFLKNGLVFEPKSGNIVRLMKSNAVFSFFLYKPGFGFLCEFFPNHQFNHERERWFVIENPETDVEARRVLEDLKNRYNVDFVRDYQKNTGIDFFTSKDFENFYTKQPKKIFGERFLSDDSDDSITWSLWKNTKKLFFQDLTGNINIGYRPVTFTKMKDGKLTPLTGELSPYYKAKDEVYVIPIKGLKDADNMETEFEISVTASSNNPYVSEVEKDDVFNILFSIVDETCSRVVSSLQCHKAGYRIHKRDLTKYDPGKVMDDISDAVSKALADPNAYFGFDIKKVKILKDIRLGGKDAIDHEEDGKKMFVQERENERALSALDNKNLLAQKEAENKKTVATFEGNAYAEKVKLETAADVQRIKDLKNVGWSIETEQQRQIMEAATSGKNNLNFANIAQIFESLVKK